MVKPISFLKVPIIEPETIGNYSKFIKLFGLLITYSPDQRTDTLLFNEQGSLAEKIINEIDKNFFQDIYIERKEKFEIISDLASRKLISISGLAGVGKTVVLKKINEEYKKNAQKLFAYVDCYEIARNENSEQILNYLSTYLYNFIKSNSSLDRYLQYLYKNFTPAGIKISFDLLYGGIDEDDVEKWRLKLYTDPIIREKLGEYNSTRKPIEFIESSIEFIEKVLNIDVILCLDNLDQLPRSELSGIFASADKINKSCAIPVIVTLRENNLRKVLIDVCASKDQGDSYSTLIVTELFSLTNKITNNAFGKIQQLTSFSSDKFRELFERRLRILIDNPALAEVKDAVNELLLESNLIVEALKISEKSSSQIYPIYREIFWSGFSKINETFFHTDIAYFCNFNVRDIARSYFYFVNSSILGPEAKDLFKLLFDSIDQSKRNEKVSIYNLRNFLYRSIIFKDYESLSQGKLRITNVFNQPFSKINSMLSLRILEFLRIFETNFKKRVKFCNLLNEFQELGYSQKQIETSISELSEIDQILQKGFIWLDGKFEISEDGNINSINGDTVISLLPSGNAFIDKLSISREYVFWSLISCDFDTNFITHSFPLSKTYMYDFQIKIIINIIKDEIIPKFDIEVNNMLSLSDNRLINKYWRYFSIPYTIYSSKKTIPLNLQDLYPVRLVKSLYYNSSVKLENEIKSCLDQVEAIQDRLLKAANIN